MFVKQIKLVWKKDSDLFLGHNDEFLKQKSTIQQKKFNKILKDKKPQHDPKTMIFNYFSCVLSEAEKSLPQKGLNFCILLIKFSHADYLVNYFTKMFVTFRFSLQDI